MDEVENYLAEEFPGKRLLARVGKGFRRLTTVDPTSIITRRNVKSFAEIKKETLRHLSLHPNVIHCFSRFRRYWELLMVFTYALSFIYTPYDVAINYGWRRNEWCSQPLFFIDYVISFTDVLCITDGIISFFTSYQDEETREIVVEPRKIVFRYLRYYFWVDLLSSIPDRLLIISFYSCKHREIWSHTIRQCPDNDEIIASHLCAFDKFWDVVDILSLLTLLSMPLFFKYLDNHIKNSRSSYTYKLIKKLLTLLFCYHGLVCLVALVIRLFASSAPNEVLVVNESAALTDESFWNRTTNNEQYIVSFFYTTYTIMLFASPIEETIQTDMTVAVILTVLGFILHIWLIAEGYMIVRTYNRPAVRFQEVRFQLKRFMTFKCLPKSIQQRIITFYDFSFNGKFIRKQEINKLLGGELKRSVSAETTRQLLTGNYFFKQLPDELLNSMAYCMTEVVFLCNDVIGNGQVQKLYLIKSGTVAVYAEDGDEVAHLHDGSLFGEMAFLLADGNYPSMNYVATEECVLLVLSRSDFMKTLAERSEILVAMRNNLRGRLKIAKGLNFV